MEENDNKYLTLIKIYKTLLVSTIIYPIFISLILKALVKPSYNVILDTKIYGLTLLISVFLLSIIHLSIWKKYYNPLNNDYFQEHISNIMKTFLLSLTILLLTLMPSLSLMSAQNYGYGLIIMTVILWFVGPLWSWIQYNYKMFKNLQLLKKRTDQ